MQGITPVPEAARELEDLLRQRRRLAGAGLSNEAQERWGSPEAREEAARRQQELRSEREAVTAELVAAVLVLRTTDPAAVHAWAEAHIRLLDAFLAASDDDVATHVARKERTEWEEVRDGTRDFVAENVFYVHPDPDLYAALFPDL